MSLQLRIDQLSAGSHTLISGLELQFAPVRKRRIAVLMITHDAADIADPALLTRLGN